MWVFCLSKSDSVYVIPTKLQFFGLNSEVNITAAVKTEMSLSCARQQQNSLLVKIIPVSYRGFQRYVIGQRIDFKEVCV